MYDASTVEKLSLEAWRKSAWFEFVKHYDHKRKVLKFLLMNPDGVFRVRLKDEVKYEGKDASEAVRIFNEL